jgi:hypothetical protein
MLADARKQPNEPQNHILIISTTNHTITINRIFTNCRVDTNA